jgi:D-ribose pyranose/furanose isomerase RbsD
MAKGPQTAPARPSKARWRQTLQERIPLFGHRNWIVVADSAYPAQVSDGIETILSNTGQIQALQEVLARIDKSRHIQAVIYTDQELEFLEEKDAPGISAYRRQLSKLLKNYTVDSRPHEQIISALDDAGKTFRVLIIKTNMTLPYTSVFLQLDCGYWSKDAECRLRAALDAASNGTDR